MGKIAKKQVQSFKSEMMVGLDQVGKKLEKGGLIQRRWEDRTVRISVMPFLTHFSSLWTRIAPTLCPIYLDIITPCLTLSVDCVVHTVIASGWIVHKYTINTHEQMNGETIGNNQPHTEYHWLFRIILTVIIMFRQ